MLFMVAYAFVIIFNSLVWIPTLVLYVASKTSATNHLSDRMTVRRHTSGDEIFTPLILDRIISSLSHIDSNRRKSVSPLFKLTAFPQKLNRRTKENDMDLHLLSLLRDLLSLFLRSVICVVDDDLPTGVEKVPDQLFTSLKSLLSQFYCFLALPCRLSSHSSCQYPG